MSDIAVIGCGVFGAVIAMRLREAGSDVTIYERLGQPLKGASYNNQNRLHLGFHYPRDLETARQCVRGFARFMEEFPDVVRGSFPNGYFISARDSMTTPDDFFKFCDEAGLAYQAIDPMDFPIPVRNVACGLLCDEVVYDSALLGRQILADLDEKQVTIRLGHELSSLTNREEKIKLSFSNGMHATHDAVVNASYANNNFLTEQLGHPVEERQFEYTVVPIIEAPFESVGVTVMDGRFMTVLPFGRSNKHLLYHVEHTVVATDISNSLNTAWLDQETAPFAKQNGEAFFASMRSACEEFVPELQNAKLCGFLQGPRMVLARKDDTDARPSIINVVQPNYLTVFSGKIDHCMWVADDVVEHFKGNLL